jgi:hypothetical protein
MKINYGINKVERRIPRLHRSKRFLHENHSMEVDFPPGNKSWDKNHEAISAAVKKTVAEKHPGWGLTGFCEDKHKQNPMEKDWADL